MRCRCLLFLSIAMLLVSTQAPVAQRGTLGYYRFPALSGDTMVFTAEGDLWRVAASGGVAQRLTAHPGEESRAAVSPDGRTIAFSAAYEGPTEVYTLSLDGGPAERRTFEGGAQVVGWTPSGEILYSTRRRSTLPNTQLVRLDPTSRRASTVPLAQASDGSYDRAQKTLFFTRLPFQGSYTRRYKGGTAQAIWRFTEGTEAVPLTADFPGTSKTPMTWNGRIYFASDRDGVMNLWSMDEQGKNLRQHTRHSTFDIQSPSLSNGRIAYQHGADIRIYDIARNTDAAVPITLVSDLDHMRERWIKSGVDWITSAHLSPTGDRVVFTARGQVFVAPTLQGRIVSATRNSKVRYRESRFLPDGKQIVTLSDESGEVELWQIPANGVGTPRQLTRDGTVLRWDAIPSPDGAHIAHFDKNQQLWIYSVAKQTQVRVATCDHGGFGDVRWSPDSRWLAYTAPAANQMTRILLYSIEKATSTPITTDRYDSFSPAWSPDGKWVYFLSNRNLVSVVTSPWGSHQPEPFFDKQTRVYLVSMAPGERSPFRPDDELMAAKKEGEKDEKEPARPAATKPPVAAAAPAPQKPASDTAAPQKPASAEPARSTPPIAVALEGIERRLVEAPIPPGNYGNLSTDGKRLYYVSREAAPGSPQTLKTCAIDNKRPDIETFRDNISGYELSLDRKKVMFRSGRDIYVVDVAAKAPTDLSRAAVPLRDWSFALDPRDEWRQMFTEAWRLERDYFYDRGMHGTDWKAMHAKYLPLVDRVTDRAELSDILAQMVSELSALHIFVRGGDLRRGPDDVQPASLGAALARDEAGGGFRVEHIYRTDPDRPERLAPLARVGVDVHEGDIITAVNGVPALLVADLGMLLRDQAGKQVLLDVKPKGSAASRSVIVEPASLAREDDLRYDEWEYTRRLAVERASQNRIGYVHLRAMGGGNIAEWQREFYPVFDREGLIIDVRHNSGGNIDSWILEKLLRKAWFYWQPRVGQPTWNMQYAFRGHLVVLCNERTASDGEAFAEGFRRLGLGKVIGTRTWGGEIWLSQNNFLVDRGIATAAETGVFGPEGQWLIEGHGVDPDVVVDNLPNATFKGEDAQLDAAVKHLLGEIARKPVTAPKAPPYPTPGTGPIRK